MKLFLMLHRDFIKLSRQWLGYYTWRTRLYFPIAYTKFIYYGLIKDKKIHLKNMGK